MIEITALQILLSHMEPQSAAREEQRRDERKRHDFESCQLKMKESYRGRVMAPCDADATSAAYFANTPVSYRGCGAFHCAIRCRNTS